VGLSRHSRDVGVSARKPLTNDVEERPTALAEGIQTRAVGVPPNEQAAYRTELYMSRRRQQQQTQPQQQNEADTQPVRPTPRNDTDGSLFVLRVGERIVLDILVDATRSSVMTFIRIDGELMAELPVLGQA
jgi:hypothetical protein